MSEFENGLRADIKRAIGYQKIRNISELVSSCRIYEEDTKAHYKVMSERRGKGQQSRPKLYSAPADKGHKSNVCDRDEKKCFRCGKKGHTLAYCKHGDVVFYNCDEEGNISSQCTQPKKVRTGGKVFTLTGTQIVNED
ncbi:cellular nucleic acid-binding protein-like [Medicago truncatula]|uniref:cellular nucleic acid-binding protein-like n=1 Tax=Medicago truncatula TaxID=3880 RepID=UPI00196886CC|nr:cellular nucleic acid-binding protein-like [Medicago truncatula]